LRPSLCELADLTARQILTERDQEEAGQQLLKQSRREIVVLSLGPGTRCWLRWKDASGLRLFRSPARSTLGVGDSALAGVVVGLWRGMPPRDAIRIGMAAGATALQGSDTQLRRRSDVERLYTDAKILQGACDSDQSGEAPTPPYCSGRRPSPIPAAFPLKPRSPPPGLLSHLRRRQCGSGPNFAYPYQVRCRVN
jgi:pfkB family carbohydrate kinase